MRCEEVQAILEEASAGEPSESLHAHLSTCSKCGAWARDWGLMRAGFRALASERVPEATLGFAARVVRRLEEAADSGGAAAEFLERVGRQVVCATLLLALTALLALLVPSTGPLRGQAAADLYLSQPDVLAAENDPVGADPVPELRGPSPSKSTPGGEKGQK